MTTLQFDPDFCLETSRLRLRMLTQADYPAYAAIMQSSRAIPMGGPLTDREAWGMFCHCAGSWMLFGYGALMIVGKATGMDMGMVSINGGPLFTEPALGWILFDGSCGDCCRPSAGTAMQPKRQRRCAIGRSMCAACQRW